MNDMDDEYDISRHRRYRPRSGHYHNEQWILRYLADRTSLSDSDLRGGDSLVDVFMGKERALVVLDRLRRKGQVRCFWSRDNGITSFVRVHDSLRCFRSPTVSILRFEASH